MRRTVDNQVKLVNSKEVSDRSPVPNGLCRMRESLGHTLQPFQIPERVTVRAEKHSTHIVVHPDDFVPLAVEMLDGFRADQSAAARDQNFHETVERRLLIEALV